jgi:hypothetical protein
VALAKAKQLVFTEPLDAERYFRELDVRYRLDELLTKSTYVEPIASPGRTKDGEVIRAYRARVEIPPVLMSREETGDLMARTSDGRLVRVVRYDHETRTNWPERRPGYLSGRIVDDVLDPDEIRKLSFVDDTNRTQPLIGNEMLRVVPSASTKRYKPQMDHFAALASKVRTMAGQSSVTAQIAVARDFGVGFAGSDREDARGASPRIKVAYPDLQETDETGLLIWLRGNKAQVKAFVPVLPPQRIENFPPDLQRTYFTLAKMVMDDLRDNVDIARDSRVEQLTRQLAQSTDYTEVRDWFGPERADQLHQLSVDRAWSPGRLLLEGADEVIPQRYDHMIGAETTAPWEPAPRPVDHQRPLAPAPAMTNAPGPEVDQQAWGQVWGNASFDLTPFVRTKPEPKPEQRIPSAMQRPSAASPVLTAEDISGLLRVEMPPPAAPSASQTVDPVLGEPTLRRREDPTSIVRPDAHAEMLERPAPVRESLQPWMDQPVYRPYVLQRNWPTSSPSETGSVRVPRQSREQQRSVRAAIEALADDRRDVLANLLGTDLEVVGNTSNQIVRTQYLEVAGKLLDRGEFVEHGVVADTNLLAEADRFRCSLPPEAQWQPTRDREGGQWPGYLIARDGSRIPEHSAELLKRVIAGIRAVGAEDGDVGNMEFVAPDAQPVGGRTPGFSHVPVTVEQVLVDQVAGSVQPSRNPVSL